MATQMAEEDRLASIGLQTGCGSASACAAPCRGYYVIKNNAYLDAARLQGPWGRLAARWNTWSVRQPSAAWGGTCDPIACTDF